VEDRIGVEWGGEQPNWRHEDLAPAAVTEAAERGLRTLREVFGCEDDPMVVKMFEVMVTVPVAVPTKPVGLPDPYGGPDEPDPELEESHDWEGLVSTLGADRDEGRLTRSPSPTRGEPR
jgi:hypothetical protein